MKLDPGAEIAADKVRDYLLAVREEGDKSRFFERAGYQQVDWQRLAQDLREQILPLDAFLSRRSVYGDFYTVEGALTGPNGTLLQIVTVWMTARSDGITRFVTAVPARRRRSAHDNPTV